MPFLILGMTAIHIQQLHSTGSSNPVGTSSQSDNIALMPQYGTKDLIGLTVYLITLSTILSYHSELLGHADNSIEANALQTPLHIVPE